MRTYYSRRETLHHNGQVLGLDAPVELTDAEAAQQLKSGAVSVEPLHSHHNSPWFGHVPIGGPHGESNTPQREGDASMSDAGAADSSGSTAVGGEPTKEATPEDATTSSSAADVPPDVDSGSRGEGAGHGPVAPGSSTPSRTPAKAPAKAGATKTAKAKA